MTSTSHPISSKGTIKNPAGILQRKKYNLEFDASFYFVKAKYLEKNKKTIYDKSNLVSAVSLPWKIDGVLESEYEYAAWGIVFPVSCQQVTSSIS
jgi:hypothetical protein